MKTTQELTEFMTVPSERLVADVKRLRGKLMIIGAGGKIGPALAVKAKRAFMQAGMNTPVYAVSLFDYPDAAETMRRSGVEVIEADIGDPARLAALPDAENIIYMIGKKFGTTGNESLTWYVNVVLPYLMAQRFPKANIVAFSTGNVYNSAAIYSGGSREEDIPRPVGEYSETCLGRERILEHCSLQNNTPMLFFRLSYAIDMRYGVLYDIAKAVLEERPIDVTQGVFNCIWQGDVCEYAIRSLLHTSVPPMILNVSSPEAFSIRWVAAEFGKRFKKEPKFIGHEAGTSNFSDCQRMLQLMNAPSVCVIDMIDMVADWIKHGGEALNAPTHFETTDGKY